MSAAPPASNQSGADKPARPFSLSVVYKILLAEFVVGFALWYAMADGLKDLRGTPLGSDFINVYAAGLLANGGWPEIVYDWPTHWLLEKNVAGYDSPYFAWHYPPMFLAVASLIATLPYLWAFAVYIAGGFVAYLAVLKRIVMRDREALWMLAAFPGVFCNLINGQNGFLTTALLGGGLLLLEKRPWVAGSLLGLLAYKPQFFFAVPLLLAAGGYWRAFFATGTAVLLTAGLSLALWGADTWLAFFNSLGLTQHVILEKGATGFQKIQSVFAMARLWHMDIASAYAFQAVTAVVALLCAAWIWRRNASVATKVSSLTAALILTTPYLLDYDLVILAVPIAFLIREAEGKPLLFHEKAVVAALWLLPLFARMLGGFSVPVTPPLMIVLMVMCLERVKSSSCSKTPVPQH